MANLETCRIPLEEIILATKNFSPETQVGDGGFGMVYRGQLSEQWDHRSVAIKRLHPNGYQGNTEFYNELEMVKTFKHPNIIPFIGYCDDANEKIVVYEYASNISLDHHLQNPEKRRCLTWTQRLKICLGAARGLKYLHSGVEEHRRVIHRDVKSANILLDDNLEAKICDFGLSRFSPRNQPDTHVRTRASGTKFYIDPVYNERGRLTKESDIYSFGVVMFEMSTGTMAYDARRFEEANDQYLIGIVRSTYEEHDPITVLDKLVDPALRGRMDVNSFHKFNEIAYKCIDLYTKERPTMDRIIEGIEEALNVQLGFGPMKIPKFQLENFLDAFYIPDYILVPQEEVNVPLVGPTCPTIVFINSKSGRQLGNDLLVTYRSVLNKNQVFFCYVLINLRSVWMGGIK